MYRLHKSRVGLQNPVPQKGKALCSSGALDGGARRAALSPLCLRSGHHLSSSSTARLRRYFDGNGARAVTSRARMRWRQCGGCGGTCVELGYDGTAARAMENVNSYALTSIHLAWKAAFSYYSIGKLLLNLKFVPCPDYCV